MKTLRNFRKTSMEKRINHSMIITQKLENVSKKIFDKHKKIIIQYIGSKPGVYALYVEKKLYYVGRASDLAKRVNDHLKDQHSTHWTHFSVYFTKKAQYANDIEAVVVSIAQPKGNKTKPKLGKETKLKDIIRKAIEGKQKEELRELGLSRKKQNNLKKKGKNRPNLKNYFEKSRPLRKTYKGNTHRATLLKSGKIKYKNKTYNTPTSAAQVIVRKYSPSSSVNGWGFWFVKNSENNWIKLSDLD